MSSGYVPAPDVVDGVEEERLVLCVDIVDPLQRRM